MEGRREAAIHLAQVTGEDLQKNLQILKGLLADAQVQVQMEAAVSLLILGENNAQSYITKWLSNDKWQKAQIIQSLLRVADPQKILFAQELINKCIDDATLDDFIQKNAKKLIDSLQSLHGN